jgi:hypothetical protein
VFEEKSLIANFQYLATVIEKKVFQHWFGQAGELALKARNIKMGARGSSRAEKAH